MPNMVDPNNDELELDIVSESEPVDAQTTDNGEGEKTELQLEESNAQVPSKPLTPAEQSALVQEEAWIKNIIEGKKDVDEAPKWLQSRLQKRLDSISKVPAIEEVAREVAQKEIQRQQEESAFYDLQKSIPPLSSTDAAQLKAKYAELRPLGKVKALEVAMQVLGISMDKQEEAGIQKARGRMSLPPSSSVPRNNNKDDLVSVAKDQKRWKDFVKSQGSGYIVTEP